jgi:hypothetical protein
MEGGSGLDRIDKPVDFHTPVEELELLQSELAGIRSLLSEITAKLTQIERHVRRAFPDAKPARTGTAKPRIDNADKDKPSLVHDTALELFETLRQVAVNEGSGAIEKRLSELNMADVRFLSQELGLPSGSKLSRTKLNAGIVGRLNESILLSRNVNVTQSRSEQETEAYDPFKPRQRKFNFEDEGK